jgi:hypothetical protein
VAGVDNGGGKAMKIVGSFLRFLLVMIGSFFLAIGILIVNACRSAARAMSGPAIPKTQAQLDTKSAEATSNEHPWVILKDGNSTTKGEALSGSVAIQTDNGRIDVPLSRMRRLLFNRDNKTATVFMTDGSIVSGALVWFKFEIATEVNLTTTEGNWIDTIEYLVVEPLDKPEEKTIEELMKQLASKVPSESKRAAEGLIIKGQEAVPKLKEALVNSNSSFRTRIAQVLETLGWYVTRSGKVEKMSESKEFQEMMRKRLPEMQAE